ncbi:hypothetical protein [Nesterenkonia rhizosphaerae]|uniref:Uncharacterized protein n=1 Tax=Nesterenkonia rhizosphaerae TaxID=1348272 RepID=A0ABP9FU64_9MICC
MVTMNDFLERVRAEHDAEVAKGLHDQDCEHSTSEGFLLCHCSKRRREAEGRTALPTLSWNYPTCTGCWEEVSHDGDSFRCQRCKVSWSSDATDGDTADHFDDDYGDISRCPECQRRGCTRSDHGRVNV